MACEYHQVVSVLTLVRIDVLVLIVLVLSQGAAYGFELLRGKSRPNLFGAVVQILRQAGVACTALLRCGHVKQNPVEAKVRELVVEARMQRFAHFVRMTSMLAMPFCIFMVPNLLRQGVFRSMDEETATDLYYTRMNGNHLHILAVCTLCSVLSSFKKLTATLVDTLMILPFILMAVYSYFTPRNFNLVQDIYAVRSMRTIIATIGCGTVAQISVLNLFLSMFFIFLMQSRWCDELDGHFTLQFTAFSELTQGVMLPVLIAHMLKTWDSNLARANLEARLASQGRTAVDAVLSALCDAVVHVDEGCRIVEPAPKLAGLLLREPQVGSLQGSSLVDLVMEEDRPNFASYIGREALHQEATVAPALHVRLQDARGHGVLVQLLHGRCVEVDGSCGHLLGIRDLNCDSPDRGEGGFEVRQVSHNSSDGSMSQLSTISGVSSLFAAVAASPVQRQMSRCQVDFAAVPPYEIFWCSTTFLKLCNPVRPGQSLEMVLLEPPGLLAQLATRARLICAGTAEAGIFSLEEVQVKASLGRRPWVRAQVFFPEPNKEHYAISLQLFRIKGKGQKGAGSPVAIGRTASGGSDGPPPAFLTEDGRLVGRTASGGSDELAMEDGRLVGRTASGASDELPTEADDEALEVSPSPTASPMASEPRLQALPAGDPEVGRCSL